MAGSESFLPEEFVRGDREAFCRIVQWYGGMVYGASLHVQRVRMRW
jgi:hypothetical protein